MLAFIIRIYHNARSSEGQTARAVFTLHTSTVQANILAILLSWDSSVSTVRSSQSHYEHY
jgi:hypothetical protein